MGSRTILVKLRHPTQRPTAWASGTQVRGRGHEGNLHCDEVFPHLSRNLGHSFEKGRGVGTKGLQHDPTPAGLVEALTCFRVFHVLPGLHAKLAKLFGQIPEFLENGSI